MPIKLLSRLLGAAADPREAMRPLWYRVVEIAREKRWYAELGVADTVEGRFDMITAILSLVLLRMEGEEDLAQPSVHLTELFVEDMDGQLRESGVGDLVVGKHIGRLVAALGGRLGAYRAGLAEEGDAALRDAAARNIGLLHGAEPAGVAAALREFHGKLAETGSERILAGEI